MVEKSKKSLEETKRSGPYVHQPKSVRGVATPVKKGPNGYPTIKTAKEGPNGVPEYTPYK